MKQLVEKVYNIFSNQLSKWFIFVGMVCFGLIFIITFIGGFVAFPGEALYHIIYLAFGLSILIGLLIGHYKSKEHILILAFLAYIFYLVYEGIVSDSIGASTLGDAGAGFVLGWLFTLFADIAVAVMIVFMFFVYVVKSKKLRFALQISFLASLFFGFIAWIFGIVSAASGSGWTSAVLPLLLLGSLLMIPGLLEEMFPGSLEESKEEE